MDKYNRENPNNLRAEFIKISYQGVNAEEEARILQDELYKQLHLKINPPTEIPDRIARLGVAEVIITIILAPIVQYAVNSILDTLQDFFRKKRPCKGQIIIKLDENDLGKRFPFLKETNWEEFVKFIDKYISERKSSSLSELIKERVKIDEEIRSLFETEATFLDIDVVASKKLIKDESDLMIIAYSFEEYHKYVKEKVEENKGKVLNAVGDEMMAWFETPSDAINCALAIFKSRDNFNKRRNKLKNSFQFRIGINTGVALIDEKEGKAFSSGVLDLAGHLQKNAEPGIFLISEDTYNQLEDKTNFHKYKYIKRDETWSYIFKGGGTACNMM